MARHDGELRASAGQPLSLHEVLSLLEETADADPVRRQEAIACYLSGGDGWRDAVLRLGGAFAQNEPRLRERKSD